ncbi:serine/threonine-protein kinase [Nonomuraea sp. NPDC002799]
MSDSTVMVGGRYRLLKTIGRGGMGTVWHAHDEVLGRDVAVKEVLPPPDLSGPEREVFAARTLREARTAGRVAHPGVAAVYDVLEEGGHPWIVMQLVPSRTLGDLIRDDGPMTPAAAANVGLRLLEALRAAHAVGVLHRDVKPDNVLLAHDGRVVLTDFGIATTEDEAPVTSTGILIGTPSFMPPERAAGGRARPASDLWSLGVTLYLAVEGHSPFHRDNALATLGAVMHAEPEPMARAGVLAPVLHGLLRKDPEQRMTLEETEGRLAAILGGGVPDRTRPVPFQEAPRRRRALPLAAIAAGTLLVGIVTGGAAWWSNRPSGLPSTPSSAPAVVATSPGRGDSAPDKSSGPAAPQSSPPPTREQPRTPSSGERSPSGKPTPTPTSTPTKSKKAKPEEGSDEQTSTPESPSQVEPSDEEEQ